MLSLMKDSLDELLLCLDLRILDNEGVWCVLRTLAAALHRWSSETAPLVTDGVNPIIINEMKMCVLLSVGR